MRRLFIVTSLLVAGLTSSAARAHIQLDSPTPRLNMTTAQKIYPCGNLPRSASPTQVAAGQTLDVSWHELIDHPGWYRISLSYGNDTGFEQNILADHITDGPMGSYVQTVQLP